MVSSRWPNESKYGFGFRPTIIAWKDTAELKFLIFPISVLNRSINMVQLLLNSNYNPTKLVVLFSTTRLVAKRALNCFVRSLFERKYPLGRQGNVLHLTPSEASRSIILELMSMTNSWVGQTFLHMA